MSIFYIPRPSSFGQNVTPYDGAGLYFFEAGTSTPKNTYKDPAETVLHEVPVPANANGVFPSIYLSGTFKAVLRDKNEVQVWEEDNLQTLSGQLSYRGDFDSSSNGGDYPPSGQTGDTYRVTESFVLNAASGSHQLYEGDFILANQLVSGPLDSDWDIIRGGSIRVDVLTIDPGAPSESLQIDASGDLAVPNGSLTVGTVTPPSGVDLYLYNATGGTLQRIVSGDASSVVRQLQLHNDLADELSIGKSGSVADVFGTGSGVLLNRGGNLNIISDSNDPIIFYTDPTDSKDLSATEKMRLTPSGELTVGNGGATKGTVSAFGAPTGTSDGGEFRCYVADDYDGTISYWRVYADQDDLRIGNPSDGLVIVVQGGTGRIGVGTDSPAGELDIQSDSADQTRLLITNTSATGGSSLVFENSGGVETTWELRTSPTDGDIQIIDQDSGTTPLKVAEGAPTNSLRVNSSGNVGLGTDTPTSLLNVVAPGTSIITLHNDLGNVAADTLLGGIDFSHEDPTSPGIKAFIRALSEDLGSDAYLSFGTDEGTGTAVENIRVTSTGRIGVGTVNPISLLQIGDGTTVNGDNRIVFGKRVAASQINLPVIGHTSPDGVQNSLAIATTSGTGQIYFMTGVATSGSINHTQTRMVITYEGNVGVGTESPGNALHIVRDTDPLVTLAKGTDSADEKTSILWQDRFIGDVPTDAIRISSLRDSTAVRWATVFEANSGAGLAERMRISAFGALLINSTSNDQMTTGITINQGSNDDEILTLQSSDIDHGMTALTDTETFLYVHKASATEGGADLRAFTETNCALSLFGFVTTPDTSDTTSSGAAVEVKASRKSGSSALFLDPDENVFGVRTGITSTVFLVKGNGDTTVFGDIKGESGVLRLAETTTPTAVPNYGKLYCQTDDLLYFQNGSGSSKEIALTESTSGTHSASGHPWASGTDVLSYTLTKTGKTVTLAVVGHTAAATSSNLITFSLLIPSGWEPAHQFSEYLVIVDDNSVQVVGRALVTQTGAVQIGVGPTGAAFQNAGFAGYSSFVITWTT